MKRVFVVGGAGFIGSRLCSILDREKSDFTIIDKVVSTKYPNKTIKADVRSLEQLRASISDDAFIVHLAAEHSDNVTPRSLYDEVNVNGAVNICKIADEKKIKKIIFTSSVAVYGFAPSGTNESGVIKPFGDYGRTKYEAEQVFNNWQKSEPSKRTLVIVRPTVVFGEANRGNVYNLLSQIYSGKFIMVGSGQNKKSLAYVENVAAFLRRSLDMDSGIHVFNYVDKPDLTMSSLVFRVRKTLGISNSLPIKIPYAIGLLGGFCFDVLSKITKKTFSVSLIRVKKFCAESVYDSAVFRTNFIPPIELEDAIERTVKYEFFESHENDHVFFSE